MKKLLIILLCFWSGLLFASNQVVNVYNWSGYIPPKVLSLFEKETGIHVNYSTFEDNQSLYTKLKADPNAGYDIAVPSTYIVSRMAHEGMLHKIDKSKLPNFKYLDPKLLNQSYDPGNEYSVPYLWGTTGLIVNADVFPKGSVTSWKDLWSPRFKGKIALLDDMRDVFSMALKVLGYSINDENPKHIKQAYLKLRQLLPNVQSFDTNGSQQMYVNEDSNIGMMANGDAYSVIQEAPEYYYVYPADGANMWMDNLVIPINAPHLENAYRFINFILRPDIAKMISIGIGYATPNKAAIKLLSKSERDNRILYPTKHDLQNVQMETDISKKALKLYIKYWELLKLDAGLSH